MRQKRLDLGRALIARVALDTRLAVKTALPFRTIMRTLFTRSIEGVPVVRTLTASEARANLYRLMDQAAESHQPIVIAGKRTNAVLVSAEDWEAIQETLFLLSIPGLRESIRAGMEEPLESGSKELDW